MRKIAFTNQKGGVGKTTSAVNLAACLAHLGRKVLIVDLDPQANASLAFGVPVNEHSPNAYHVISGAAPAAEAIVRKGDRLHILPSSLDLAGAELELVNAIGRETALREALAPLDSYDYVLVDCPPSLGILNINALGYASEVFIPLQAEFFALQGISLLTRTIGLVKRKINPGLSVTGVLVCMYDARTSLSREVIAEIERHFTSRVFRTRIRGNVRLAEAPSHALPIIEYAPSSYGAHDYLSLAREVLAMEEGPVAGSALAAPPPPLAAPRAAEIPSAAESPDGGRRLPPGV